MHLQRALRVTRQSRLAFTGAGGKTSALFRLARELEPPVLVTTTTHLAQDQLALADRHLIITAPDVFSSIAVEDISGVVVCTGPVGEDGRALGLSGVLLEEFRRLADDHCLPVFIEADGSRLRPLKAPAEHEPAVPDWVDTVVVVAGLSCLGLPLEASNVHRPERFATLSGLRLGESVTSEGVARMLCHPAGGLKGIPNAARKAVLLNQADTVESKEAAHLIARQLLGTFDMIVVSSMLNPSEPVSTVHERIAAVILAAGGSERFGSPKILLDWMGVSFIRRVVQTALESDWLSPVIVVLGSVVEPAVSQLSDLPVQIVINERWQEGQSTSVRRALAHLPRYSGGAIFLLADQPQVTSALLDALVEKHAVTLAPIIVPRVTGKRANPALLDVSIFEALRNLTGDTGGRALFDQYPFTYVEWGDPTLLLDVDTPQDYQRLMELVTTLR